MIVHFFVKPCAARFRTAGNAACRRRPARRRIDAAGWVGRSPRDSSPARALSPHPLDFPLVRWWSSSDVNSSNNLNQIRGCRRRRREEREVSAWVPSWSRRRSGRAPTRVVRLAVRFAVGLRHFDSMVLSALVLNRPPSIQSRGAGSSLGKEPRKNFRCDCAFRARFTLSGAEDQSDE